MPGDRLSRHRHQRIARSRAADERRRERLGLARDRRRPAGRRTARSRARPGAAGASRGRCRCARDPSCPARPPPAGRSGARGHRRRAAADRCTCRTRCDSRAGTRRARRRCCSRCATGWTCRAPAPSRSRGWLMPSAKPNGSTPSRSGGLEPAQRLERRRSTRSPVVRCTKPARRPGSAKNITSRCGTRRRRPIPTARRVAADVPEPPRTAVFRHARRGTRERSRRSTAAGTPSASSPARRERDLQRGRRRRVVRCRRW